MALQQRELQLRDAGSKASHRMLDARLVQLDHIQRSLHQQCDATRLNGVPRLIEPKHHAVALKEQISRAVAVLGPLIAHASRSEAQHRSSWITERDDQPLGAAAQAPALRALSRQSPLLGVS